jgi:hypothetical protein
MRFLLNDASCCARLVTCSPFRLGKQAIQRRAIEQPPVGNDGVNPPGLRGYMGI